VNVLMSAYACGPNKGSEPGVGWNVAREVSRYHDTWLLTSTENEAAIREALARDRVDRLHLVFIDPGGWTLDMRTRRRWIPWQDHVHYYAWQIAAYRKGRSLHGRIGFDIVHHVTYVRYYSPSFLSLLPVPFLWGPVGGAESAPLSFWTGFGLRGIIYESLRSLARHLGEVDPFVRMTARRSAVARATTPETAARLRKIGARNVEIIHEVGIAERDVPPSSVEAPPDTEHRAHAPFFLTVARLLHWKGIHLSLRAFSQARLPNTEYWIVGPGPDRPRLESLTRKLGLTERVRFIGEVPRGEVRGLLDNCVALVHPSLHDSGGVACLDAMAAGKPVICLATGGPATQVTGDTGFLVSVANPRETIDGIADAMRRLGEDEALRTTLGKNGSRRAREHFTWQKRGRVLSDLYEQLCRGYVQ
jgi:glycosyltransferase involved in cell wall biosynthesis